MAIDWFTEKLWFTGARTALLTYLEGRATPRKLRLFATTCCARWIPLPLLDEGSRIGLAAAIDFAEGRIGEEQLAAAERMAADAANKHSELSDAIGNLALAVWWTTKPNSGVWNAAYQAAYCCECAARDPWVEASVHTRLLRDMFGNPFRPVAFDPALRTPDVMLLAEGAYAEEAFDRLPILADALQDAGCDSDDLLTHLRDPNATHVRGCWALDLVLGKE